ncbi:MAG TPA: hypothetical protein VF062_20250 [Candidatus Limnocylindrales bacterium]
MNTILTVDDLQAMQRAVGIWLPGFATEPDGFGVRDELDLDEVTRLAEAFCDAVLAVEVQTDRAGEVTEYAFSIGPSGEMGMLEALPGGLVRFWAVEGGDAVAAVAGVAGLDPDVVTAAEGPRWTVSPVVYRRCDKQALAGDEEAAVTTLTRVGVDPGTAKTWVAAMSGRGGAAAVTVVRRDPDTGRLEAGELRWGADETGAAWRITADENAYAMTPASGPELYAALRELMREGEHG